MNSATNNNREGQAMTGTCSKCDGRGRIDAFSHIRNGSCFACQGSGRVEIEAAKSQAAPVLPALAVISVDGFRLTAGEAGLVYVEDFSLDRAERSIGALWCLISGPEFSDGLRCLTQVQKMRLARAARDRWGAY